MRSSSIPAFDSDSDEVIAALGRDAFIWFKDTVSLGIRYKGFPLLGQYLCLLAREVAESRVVAVRFDNEERVWAHKSQELGRVANQTANDYQAMTFAIENERSRSDGSAPLSMLEFAPRLATVNTTVRAALESMLRLNMLLDQEISYQQDMFNTYKRQDVLVRQGLHSKVTSLSARIATIASLVDGQATGLNLTVSDPQQRVQGQGGDWVDVIRDLLAAYVESTTDYSAGQLTLISSPAVTSAFEMFRDLVAGVMSSHSRFQCQIRLLSENARVAAAMTPDGALPTSTDLAVSNFNTLSSGKYQGFASSLKAAALREMLSLVDGPQKQVVQYTLDILESLGEPGRLAAERDAAAWQVRPEVLQRRLQLQADAFFMLQNEGQERAARQEARFQGVSNVPADPTVDQLWRRILASARGDEGDRQYLGNIFTPREIANNLDASALFAIM